MPYTFLAGAAREIITPPLGTPLYGYNDHTPGASLHDDLTATALAVRQGDTTALLYSVTLCEIEVPVQKKLRETLAERLGVPAEHILVSCTHTHCGPNLCGITGCGPVNWQYYDEIFLPALTKAGQTALQNMAPAEYAVGETQSFVGINRRDMLADGTYHMGQNPFALIDPTLTAVTFRHTETKQAFFHLLHYGCHGTSAGNCTIITRDWSGGMIDRVEAETGVLSAFWNGSEGDAGPRLKNGRTTGDIHDTEELGAIAGEDALRALQARGEYRPGEVLIACGELTVPYLAPQGVEEVEEKLLAMGPREEMHDNGTIITWEYWTRLLRRLRAGEELPSHFVCEQTIVSIGDVVLVPFPFEMFAETVLRLRRFIPKPHVLCLSVTNGFEQYLPTEADICRGGYEVQCLLYGHDLPMPHNTEQQLMNATLALAAKL